MRRFDKGGVDTRIKKAEKYLQTNKKILDIKKEKPESDISPLEHRIDRIVYDLYSLTPEGCDGYAPMPAYLGPNSPPPEGWQAKPDGVVQA